MNFFSSQPTPFDLRWRMFGIPIRVHPTFWLFCWAFSYFYQPIRNLHWGYTLLFIGLMFLAVLWHDLGHALLIRLFGYRVQIILFGMGGAPVGEFEQAKRWQRIVIHMGGPAAGFLLWLLTEQVKRFDPAGANLVLWRGIDFMLFETFLWNAMNLLPVIPLDFGEVMRELVSAVFRKKGRILALMLSIIFAGLIAGYSEQIWRWAGQNWSPCFWVMQRLNPLVTAIFFGIYALMNFFSLIGELFAKRKDEEKPVEDEFAEPAERYT